MKLKTLFESVIPFTTTTTHMPSYDDMMKDPEYFKTKKHKVFSIVHMSPDEYINQAFDAFKQFGELKPWHDKRDLERSRSATLINKYAEKMSQGEKFPMLVLDFTSQYRGFSGGKEKSFSQEGLHRAYAARSLGIKSIPVMVVDDA